MKSAFLIVFIGTWGIQLFLPWWTLVIPCFIAGVIGPDRGYKAFVSGLLGVGLLWFLLAFVADWYSGWLLAEKVTVVMQMPGKWALYATTIIIGGLTGAFACLSGYLVLGRTK